MVPIPVAAVLEPAPPPFVMSELASCGTGDLSLAFDGEYGAFDGMQRSGTLMVVRNIGAKPCRLTALPSVSFQGADGAALPIRFGPPAGFHPGPAVPDVGLAPGSEVTAELRWLSGDAIPGGRCFRTATVRVSFGKAVLGDAFVAHICGPGAKPATFAQGWLRPDARLRR